jgi:hypothetical protein
MASQSIRSAEGYFQFLLENQVLGHVKTALRKTLAADEKQMGRERKVSTVQFVADSLVRHLRRLLELEDDEEVDPAEQGKPHLAEKVAVLQREHDEFRRVLDHLAQGVARIGSENEPDFVAFCEELTAFLNHLDRHEAAESDLLQQLHNADEGGEG